MLKKLRNIRFVNLYKLINIACLYVYYQRLTSSKDKWNYLESRAVPPPYFLSFEPTNYCNLKCVACPSGAGQLTRPKGYADFELLKKLIDENKDALINIVLHFQGEPILNKNLGKMIRYANANNIRTEFSTNANIPISELKEVLDSKPSKIIISLDGLSQETYNKYRVNGDINKVINSLEAIKNIKRRNRPIVELQFIVFRHNEHEIKDLKALKKKYKIDKITLKTAQIYGDEQIHLIPEDIKLSRYKIDENGHAKLKKEIKNKCKRVIFGSVITWDGKIVPCCFDKDANFILGNTKTTDIDIIRNNEKYKQFIKNVFSQRKEIEMCNNCTES